MSTWARQIHLNVRAGHLMDSGVDRYQTFSSSLSECQRKMKRKTKSNLVNWRSLPVKLILIQFFSVVRSHDKRRRVALVVSQWAWRCCRCVLLRRQPTRSLWFRPEPELWCSELRSRWARLSWGWDSNRRRREKTRSQSIVFLILV